MLKDALRHFLENVLPAADDYERAEKGLSRAFKQNDDPQSWAAEGQHAKRRAAEAAIAIDGLADRAAATFGLTPDDVRSLVAALCAINGTPRGGTIERVCAVANAYKHAGPLRAKHPIHSESDVLATGAGFGLDAYGVGKFSGVEVLVNQKDGTVRKFLGDVPWAIAGWLQFLADHGSPAPAGDYIICGMRLAASTVPPAAGTSIP